MPEHIRIKFSVRSRDGRAVSWDESKPGDYSPASMALMAVAMGDDDFRRAVIALAEETLPGISTLVDGETGETVGMTVVPPLAMPKPIIALDCPDMTEAEFIADPDNAIIVTCRWDPTLSDEQNVYGILARAQHGPDTMAIEAIGFVNMTVRAGEGGELLATPFMATDFAEGKRPTEFQIRVWDRMSWLKARTT